MKRPEIQLYIIHVHSVSVLKTSFQNHKIRKSYIINISVIPCIAGILYHVSHQGSPT